jgi:hypothetical protein
MTANIVKRQGLQEAPDVWVSLVAKGKADVKVNILNHTR